MVCRLYIRRNALEEASIHGRLRNRLDFQDIQSSWNTPRK